MKMAPAFLLYLGYLMLLANARSAMAEGEGNAAGLWVVHLGFLALALALLYGPGIRGRLKHRRYLNAQA